MPTPRVVLASMSPRRRDLLGRLGIPFTVRPAHADEEALETAFTGLAEDLALFLATHKAQAIAAAIHTEDERTDQIVLAADTTVILDGQILGKPRDGAEATAMLHRLRGRTHLVRTGVVALDVATGKLMTHAITTPVTMRDYTDNEITAYIATGDPFDKAGSYAMQHVGFHPAARIAGCATNVIGLPLCAVVPMLHLLGAWPGQMSAPDPQRHTCPWDERCAPQAQNK